MKKITLFVLLAYGVLFIMLTLPIFIASFSPFPLPPGRISDFFEFLKWPHYWIFFVIFLLCQAGLLFIPVKIESRRPTSKRSIYLPVIVSGFLIGALCLGAICSLDEFIFKDKAFSNNWTGWAAIGICIAIWTVWSVIFYSISKDKDPRNIVLSQCRILLHSGIISLLVAVPAHIVARNRGYCCAGVYTFVGITFGIAVMLLSFGPGIFFLYAERWGKSHPGEK